MRHLTKNCNACWKEKKLIKTQSEETKLSESDMAQILLLSDGEF